MTPSLSSVMCSKRTPPISANQGVQLETVFDRHGDDVEPLVVGYRGSSGAVSSAIRIDDVDGVLGKSARVLLERDLVAADLELGGKAIFHAEEVRIPDEIGVVADHVLIMRDEEAITVDRRVGVGLKA